MAVRSEQLPGDTQQVTFEHDMASCDATDSAFVVSCTCGWTSLPDAKAGAMTAWKSHVVDTDRADAQRVSEQSAQ
jgi:hypothetical protein